MSRKHKNGKDRTGLPRRRYHLDARTSQDVLGYKFSEVFADFARPYLDDAEDIDEVSRIYGAAAISWNLALLPRHERIRPLAETMRDMPVEHRLLFKNAIAEMIARKEESFADYDRPITSYEVVDRGKTYHLTVATEIILEGEEAEGVEGK
jgi:hypothetical protein